MLHARRFNQIRHQNGRMDDAARAEHVATRVAETRTAMAVAQRRLAGRVTLYRLAMLPAGGAL